MIGFIVNPVSGNGRGRLVWNELEAVLKQRGIPYSIQFTEAKGDAANLTMQMIKGFQPDTLVAVGGDGTVSEVAYGIYLSATLCSLGYIPAGSGNDFAKGQGLPEQSRDALELVLSPSHRSRIDIIRLIDRIAVCSVGIGLDGQVAKTTNEAGYKKWLNRLGLGKSSYILSLIRVLITYKPCDVILDVDGEQIRSSNVWLIAAANMPYYGGGMMICPNAVADDGKIDVCIVSGISRWELLRVFPLVYTGRHVNHPGVRFLRGRHFRIVSDQKMYVHADGESAGETPLQFEVIPAAVSVIH